MQSVQDKVKKAGTWVAVGTILAAGTVMGVSPNKAQANSLPGGEKPNILVIWGDDIGWFNVSA